jgi:flagellar basal-body rod modification protein FlgD
MQHVMANYTLPTVLNTVKTVGSGGLVKPYSSKVTPASTTGTGSSSSTGTSGTDLGTTFLSLLAQELQNQDPTAPVDPTAMVGQMISLNQLEQLIGINQTLDNVSSSSSSSTTPSTQVAGAQTPAAQAVSSAQVAAANSGIAAMLSPSAAAAATTQLPFDANTLMPLNPANAAAVAASIRNSISAANMGFSGTNNNTSGGK